MNKLVRHVFVVGLVAAVVLVGACVTGGKEGDRCNPLVHRDECDHGLSCRASTCSVFYCCPPSTLTTEPNCQNLAGCPDTDAGIVDASTDDGG